MERGEKWGFARAKLLDRKEKQEQARFRELFKRFLREKFV
jgi:hypothetical protein